MLGLVVAESDVIYIARCMSFLISWFSQNIQSIKFSSLSKNLEMFKNWTLQNFPGS